MSASQTAKAERQLAEAGLNLLAIFDLADLLAKLPADISASLEQQYESKRFKQLMLFGHAGRQLWQALHSSDCATAAEPVDAFSIDRVRRFLAEVCPGKDFEILYPGSSRIVPLQRLGELAGWHHASPFRIGINADWGSWFAYRAVVLADSDLATTPPLAGPSPCRDCVERPCLAACPAAVAEAADIPLHACLDYRLEDGSRCQFQCPARNSCPVAAGQRYSEAQMRYHYSRSLQTIMDYRQQKA